jgi:hypothetical protein
MRGDLMHPTTHEQERGAVVLWMALMMIVFLIATAFAVDLGLAYAVKRQLSSTADAAALAGAQEAGLRFKSTNGCPGGVPDPALVNAIQAAVAATHTANDPWGSSGVPTATITCDPTQVTVAVQETSSLDTIFARVLGITTLNPGAAATANVFGSTFGGGLRPFTVCVGDARDGKGSPTTTQQSVYTSHNNPPVTGEVLAGGGNNNWAAGNDRIGSANFGLAVGDYVRLDVISGAAGADDGYYWVVWVANNGRTFEVSRAFGGTRVNVTTDGVVDVYKQPAAIGGGDTAWAVAGSVLTENGHGLAVGDQVWVAIKSGAAGATSGLHFVHSAPTPNAFTLSATAGGPRLDITSNGVVNIYEVQGLGAACNPTGAPGNWGYASFGLGPSQPVLKCLIEFGYGGASGCLGNAIGTDLGDDDPATPEVTAPGNPGNSIEPTNDFVRMLTDLVDRTILLPVAGTWDQQGNNATYTAKGGAAVQVCGFSFPRNNNDPTPSPLLAGSCWDNTLYNTAAASGHLDGVSLILQWRYVREYTGVYRGQSTSPTDMCELGGATCIPTVRLIG